MRTLGGGECWPGAPADFAEVTGLDPLILFEEELLGLFYLTPNEARPGPGEYLSLDDVVIEDGHRGEGLGSELLSAVCRYADVRRLPVLCKVRGSGSGTLEAINTVRLLGWYRRFGFTEPTVDEQRRFPYEGYGLPVLIRRPVPRLTRSSPQAAALP